MKTIYTKIDDVYYKLEQDTSVPDKVLPNTTGTSSSIQTDVADRVLAQTVTINTLESDVSLKSNKELYDEMIAFLKENEISSMKSIPESYRIYIDYSMYVDGKEIEHSSIMKPVSAVDFIYPLGVSKENETVYRRVKDIKQNIEFQLKVAIPHGIMQTASSRNIYGFKINNVSIYYDTLNGADNHESTYCNGYNGSHDVISSSKETLIKIYSTADEGFGFANTAINFAPRKIILKLDMILSNIIVAYSSDEVDKIIDSNSDDKKCNCECNCNKNNMIIREPRPKPSCEPKKLNGHIIGTRKDHNRPTADGSTVPNNDGIYDMYEQCSATNPDGLLVVTDNISDAIFDEPTMVRYSDVIADIPDIQVGDYVLYITVSVEE